MNSILRSIKRNPIILVIILGVAAQAVQKAIDDGKFDTATIGTYFLQIILGYVAREFTVPFSDHKKEVEQAFDKGLRVPYGGGEK